MFAWLCACAASAMYKYRISEYVSILQPGFGFLMNGQFKFYCYGENLSHTYVIMAYEDQVPSNPTTLLEFCQTDTLLRTTFPLSKKLANATSDFYSGAIVLPDVYVPIILNCKKSVMKVEVSLRNPNSFLDSRDQFLPYFFACFSLLYGTVVIIWIVNSMLFRQFEIKCHYCLAGIAALKGAELYAKATFWTNLINHEESIIRRFTVELFSGLVNSLFFTLNGVLVAGWGTYRDTVTQDFATSIFVICASFYVIKAIGHGDSDFGWLVFLVAIGSVCILYTNIINALVMIANELQETIGERDSVANNKLTMAVKFGRQFSFFISIFVISAMYIMFLPFSRSFDLTIEELFYACVTAIDLVSFLFKKEHEGTGTEAVRREISVAQIKEPDDAETLALIVTEMETP